MVVIHDIIVGVGVVVMVTGVGSVLSLVGVGCDGDNR